MDKLKQATLEVAFLNDTIAEVQDARENFPGNAVQTLALVEQVGKLSQALLHRREGGETDTGVYRLAVTVAAMAMRVACDGDSSVPEYKPAEVVVI